jgi:hypothetical protein
MVKAIQKVLTPNRRPEDISKALLAEIFRQAPLIPEG